MPNGVRLLVFFVLLCGVLQLLAALSMSWRENQLANWLAVGQSVLSWTVGFGLWKYRNWSKVVTLVWIGFSMPWGLLLTFTALSLAGVSFFTFPSPNLMAALWFLTITIAAGVVLYLFCPHARDFFC